MFRHAFLRRVISPAALLLLLAPGAAARQGGATAPADLARAIQARYDTIRDFGADFTHTYEGGVLRTKAVERGQVQFKKPGMMRWTYTTPEPKEFVSDGVRLYAYVPEDRQVTVSALPAGEAVSTPALFLAGRGNLTRDFVASPPERPSALAGTLAVTFTPVRPESDFEWMTLIVDRATYQIRGLITVDAQGGRSAFTFERVRENAGLADKVFRFTIPRGVDVITHTNADR